MIRRDFLLSGLVLSGSTLLPLSLSAQESAGGARKRGMAVNPGGIADWASLQPFIDVMKSARSWIGHMPGQWGGQDHHDLEAAGHLDENGWPVRIPPELSAIGTVLLTDLPEEAHLLAGRYVLRYEGEGILEVGGRVRNRRRRGKEISFDFTPGDGLIDLRITRTGNKEDGSDHIRNITIVHERNLKAHAAGELFDPDWLDLLDGFEVIRFMNWMAPNDSTQDTWANRPRVSDYAWTYKGVPLEIMLELVNRLRVDPWFTVPHLSDDEYNHNFAAMVRDRLAPGLRAYVEYSNEVWNWQFSQAAWADEQARARWGKDNAWLQFYGMRAAEISEIWRKEFGESADERLVRVISSQTGWLGLEDMALNAPLWQAEGHPPPHSFFDAYTVTGYFGSRIGNEEYAPMVRGWLRRSLREAEESADEQGLSGEERKAWIADHRYDVAVKQAQKELRDGSISGEGSDTLAHLMGEVWPWHMNVARKHGLSLIMYEGGTHVVGIGPMVDDEEITDFFIYLNYTPEMAELYHELISGWYDLGADLFNIFVDVGVPGKWGSWGGLRFLSDSNPRWDAIIAERDGLT